MIYIVTRFVIQMAYSGGFCGVFSVVALVRYTNVQCNIYSVVESWNYSTAMLVLVIYYVVDSLIQWYYIIATVVINKLHNAISHNLLTLWNMKVGWNQWLRYVSFTKLACLAMSLLSATWKFYPLHLNLH